jgi:hypothetical protein
MIHRADSAPSDHRCDGLSASLQRIDSWLTITVSEETTHLVEGPCQQIQMRSNLLESLAISVKPK